jgi:hypothetical protein
VRGKSARAIWQEKLKRLRKCLKGWNANVEAAQKKMKKQYVAEFDCLDIMLESQALLPEEIRRMEEIAKEIKPRQRSRERHFRRRHKHRVFPRSSKSKEKGKKKIAC